MAAINIKGGKALLVDGKISTNPDCCCGCPPWEPGATITVVISGVTACSDGCYHSDSYDVSAVNGTFTLIPNTDTGPGFWILIEAGNITFDQHENEDCSGAITDSETVTFGISAICSSGSWIVNITVLVFSLFNGSGASPISNINPCDDSHLASGGTATISW